MSLNYKRFSSIDRTEGQNEEKGLKGKEQRTPSHVPETLHHLYFLIESESVPGQKIQVDMCVDCWTLKMERY